MKHMKDMKHISEVIDQIEAEMVTMWSLGEAPNVMEQDEEYIELVLTAVFFEREHFQMMGLIIGEAWQNDIGKATRRQLVANG